jgi:peptide/nickel transport system permease protein
MRLMDLFFSIPTMVLAIAIVGVLGPSLTNATLAIAVVTMQQLARLVRGRVFALRELEFVQAAWPVGAPAGRILCRHLLPNLLGLVVVQATVTVSFATPTEAALSFVGLGVQPRWRRRAPCCGTGIRFWTRRRGEALAPGAAIMLTVLGLNPLRDGVRDVLDPRLRT